MKRLRRIFSTLFVICGIFSCFFIEVTDTEADIWGGASFPASCGTSCYGSGGSSFSVLPYATGYRVSVVDAQGKQVEGTHSVDYWPQQSTDCNDARGFIHLTEYCKKEVYSDTWHSEGDISSYIYSANKKTSKSSNVDISSQNGFLSYGDYNKWDFIIANSSYNRPAVKWLDGQYADSTHNNNYTRFVLEIMKYYLSQDPVPETGYKIVGQLLTNSGFDGKAAITGKSIDDSSETKISISKSDAENIIAVATNSKTSSGQPNVFLAIEPVMAILSFTLENDIYVGTSADLVKFGFISKSRVGWAYPRVSHYHPIVYAQSSTNEKIAGVQTCNLVQATDGNEETVVIPDNAKDSSHCLGIFIFDLSKSFPPTNSCAGDLSALIEAYESSGKKENDKEIFNDGIENLNDVEKSIKEKLKIKNGVAGYEKNYGMTSSNATCTPGCKDTYVRFSNEGEDALQEFLKNVLIQVFNIPTSPDQVYGKDAINKGILAKNEENACKAVNCNQILDYIKSKYDNKTTNSYYNDIRNLHDLFPTYSQLDESNYLGDDALVDEPACDNISLPECEAEVSGDCSKGSVEFKVTDADDCIKSEYHLAYNNGGVYKKAPVKVIDGKNVYCSETVTFTLPTSPRAKAGRLLAWGTNLDNENSVFSDDDRKTFGTMEIKQHCYVYDTSNNKAKISADTIIGWNDSDDTTSIDILYMSPGGTEYKDTLNKSKTNVSFSPGNEGGSIDNNGTVHTEISDYRVTATYTFNYSNEFAWFSKKGSSDKYIKASDYNSLSNNEKDKYLFIGYGLPTEFSAPTGNYNTYSDNSGADQYYISAYIKDIGTNARWDKYISNVLGQSSGYVYSCPFDIDNELFGYECLTGKCGTDNEPKGLDVVFRTVQLVNSNVTDTTSKENELKNAFPGRAGGGRSIGRNWSEIEDDESANTDKILKILSDDIYNQEPQYHIVLDVATIKKIRENNNSMGDPYTNMSEYVCNKTNSPEYGYCASEFLTKLMAGKLSGTCSNPPSTDARASKGPCGQTWWED